MSSPASPTLDLVFGKKPSDLPAFARIALQQHEVDANVILPILNKCWKQEQKGIIARDHLWIVVFVRTPEYAVKLILACTDGLTGKYPLFLFTPIPSAAMTDDRYIFPALSYAVHHLKSLVPIQRIYSVFGREVLARTFATIWTQQTNISFIRDPYYHCKISYLTRTTLEAKRRELPPISMEIRPAEQKDWEGVARLCHDFAATSPPFTLSEDGARAEAKDLILNKFVWIIKLPSHGVVSLVAFTRNSEAVGTLTKVYTQPSQRGGKLAERLVRAVCDYLLYDCCKEKVALFVGVTNPAAIVYQRVGFVGVGEGAAPAEGVDTWSEVGFDRQKVHLGHW